MHIKQNGKTIELRHKQNGTFSKLLFALIFETKYYYTLTVNCEI